jgi:hypothetical protein
MFRHVARVGRPAGRQLYRLRLLPGSARQPRPKDPAKPQHPANVPRPGKTRHQGPGARLGLRRPCAPTGREQPAMIRRFTRAVRVVEIVGIGAAVAVLAILFLPRLTGGGNADPPVIEQPNLNVAVVPAVDSAGFFVALHEGLFAAHGLHVTFIPAVSSETVSTSRTTGSTSPAATTSATSKRRKATTTASGLPRPAIPWSPPIWRFSPKAR